MIAKTLVCSSSPDPNVPCPGVVVSAFALPLVMTRAPAPAPALPAIPAPAEVVAEAEGLISVWACVLVCIANSVIFATMAGFCIIFNRDSFDYSW